MITKNKNAFYILFLEAIKCFQVHIKIRNSLIIPAHAKRFFLLPSASKSSVLLGVCGESPAASLPSARSSSNGLSGAEERRGVTGMSRTLLDFRRDIFDAAAARTELIFVNFRISANICTYR